MWEKDVYISLLFEVIGFWIVGVVNCSFLDFFCWAFILKIKKVISILYFMFNCI